MSLIPEALGDPDRWTPQLEQVAKRCGLEDAEALLTGTDPSAQFARKIAAYVLRTHGQSYAEIGRLLGRHRSTVHEHALKVARYVERDATESRTIRAILSDLDLGDEGIQR